MWLHKITTFVKLYYTAIPVTIMVAALLEKMWLNCMQPRAHALTIIIKYRSLGKIRH